MKSRRQHQIQDTPLSSNEETGGLLNALSGWIATALIQDLSQPLTAIQANAQATLNSLNSPDPDLSLAREAVSDILEDTRHLATMLETLRSPLRQPRAMKPTVPEAEVRAAVRLLTPWLRGRGFNVRLLTDARATEVILNPGAVGTGTLLALLGLLEQHQTEPRARQVLTIRALRPQADLLSVAIEINPSAVVVPTLRTGAGDINTSDDLHLATCISLVEVLGGRYCDLVDARQTRHGVQFDLPLTVVREDPAP